MRRGGAKKHKGFILERGIHGFDGNSRKFSTALFSTTALKICGLPLICGSFYSL